MKTEDLLKKIAALEKRIAELEARPASVVTIINYPPEPPPAPMPFRPQPFFPPLWRPPINNQRLLASSPLT